MPDERFGDATAAVIVIKAMVQVDSNQIAYILDSRPGD